MAERPRELEAVRNESGANPSGIDARGDAHDLYLGPAEQHRERARVVGVGSEIGIEMDQHHADSVRTATASGGAIRLM